MDIKVFVTLVFLLCNFMASGQNTNLTYWGAGGGSEVLFKHRPDLADSAYQLFYHYSSGCSQCHPAVGGLGAVRRVTLADSCNTHYCTFGVTGFTGNSFTYLYTNPYTGDSTGKPIFKQCPPGLPIPPINQAVDTFLLQRDFWYTSSIVYLPEKCGLWAINNVPPECLLK